MRRTSDTEGIYDLSNHTDVFYYSEIMHLNFDAGIGNYPTILRIPGQSISLVTPS